MINTMRGMQTGMAILWKIGRRTNCSGYHRRCLPSDWNYARLTGGFWAENSNHRGGGLENGSSVSWNLCGRPSPRWVKRLNCPPPHCTIPCSASAAIMPSIAKNVGKRDRRTQLSSSRPYQRHKHDISGAHILVIPTRIPFTRADFSAKPSAQDCTKASADTSARRIYAPPTYNNHDGSRRNQEGKGRGSKEVSSFPRFRPISSKTWDLSKFVPQVISHMLNPASPLNLPQILSKQRTSLFYLYPGKN